MKEIFIERDGKDRSKYYLAAKTRIHNEIYKQVIAFGLMTPQFKQVLVADYDLMAKRNKMLEVAEKQAAEASQNQIFRDKFKVMISNLLTDHATFSAQLLKESLPKEIKKNFSKLFQDYLNNLM